MKTLKVSLFSIFLFSALIVTSAETNAYESRSFTLKEFVQKELKLPVGYKLKDKSVTVWVIYSVNKNQICKLEKVISDNNELKNLVIHHFEQCEIKSDKNWESTQMMKISFLREQ